MSKVSSTRRHLQHHAVHLNARLQSSSSRADPAWFVGLIAAMHVRDLRAHSLKSNCGGPSRHWACRPRNTSFASMLYKLRSLESRLSTPDPQLTGSSSPSRLIEGESCQGVPRVSAKHMQVWFYVYKVVVFLSFAALNSRRAMPRA